MGIEALRRIGLAPASSDRGRIGADDDRGQRTRDDVQGGCVGLAGVVAGDRVVTDHV